MSRANLPEFKQMIQLDPSGDLTKPVLMSRPNNVTRIEWIKYNKETDEDPRDAFEYVTVVPVDQFLEVTKFDTDQSNVDTMTFNDVVWYFENDRAPQYCTFIDDHYVIFDAYDSEVDATLQSSKTLCFGQVMPVFEMTDDYIPEMDEQQFPLLLNEAKALAFFELKQMPHEKAEREARRQWVTLQRTKDVPKPVYLDQFPNYGRKV
jgi:hypothetical protein